MSPPIRKSIKRASSVSNDQLHERDRFRMRFSPDFDLESDPHAIDHELHDEESSGANPFASEHWSSVYGESLVRLLTPAVFKQAVDWYFSAELPPTQTMFPWLHGLHPGNLTQIQFFTGQQISPPPAAVRMLMTLRSAKVPGLHDRSAQLKNSVDPEEIMKKLNISREELREMVTEMVAEVYGDTAPLGMVDQLYADCVKLKCKPLFRVMDPTNGITLRNYHIQSNKASQVSDIVVYCFNDDHLMATATACRCAPLARVVEMAQRKHHKLHETAKQPPSAATVDSLLCSGKGASVSHPLGCGIEKTHHTYLLQPTAGLRCDAEKGLSALRYFALRPLALEASPSDVASPYSPAERASFLSWDVDYLQKEKLEIAQMSSATRLFDNVWVGNTSDYRHATHPEAPITSTESNLEDHRVGLTNTHRPCDFRTSITPSPRYCDPAFSLFAATPSSLRGASALEPSRAAWRIRVRCHENGGVPHTDFITALLEKVQRIVSLPQLITEPIDLNFACSGAFRLGSCTQEIVSSILNLCKVLHYALSRGLAVLLYSADGYTENSFLTMCLTMYSLGIGYGEALVRLHNEYGRPVFLFPSDQEFLIKVEQLLTRSSPAKALTAPVSDTDVVTASAADLVLEPADMTILLRKSVIALATGDDYDFLRECEGTLPSRILPHLYLGSLKHAVNLRLLQAMGITKIISIGETLPWMEAEAEVTYTPTSLTNVNIAHVSNTLSVTKVLKIENLQDDGVDSIAPVLDETLRFIDREAYGCGERVLVHCRVGVSRSASVVTAEVMTRMGIALPQAYLYVRVRRLNVIIQPNLRFFYEMFKWAETRRLRASLVKTSSVASLASHASAISLRGTVGSPPTSMGPPLQALVALMVGPTECSGKKHQRREGDHHNGCDGAGSVGEEGGGWLRLVDWFVVCREITLLNQAYVNT